MLCSEPGTRGGMGEIVPHASKEGNIKGNHGFPLRSETKRAKRSAQKRRSLVRIQAGPLIPKPMLRSLLYPSWRVVLALLAGILVIRFPLRMALGNPWLMDFQILHYTGQLVLQGDPGIYIKFYTPFMRFPYGPIWALFTAPLGLLSYPLGCVVWASMNVAFLIGSLLLCRRLCHLIGLHPSAWIAILAVLLVVKPITSEFLMGQTNLMWLTLALGFMLAYIRQRPFLAGLCLALAISHKLPAIIFLVYLLFRRDVRTSGITLVWMLALNVGAAWLLSHGHLIQLFKDWYGVLAQIPPNNAFRMENQTLLGLFGRYLREDAYGLNVAAWPLGVIVTLSLVGGILLFTFALERPSSRENASLRPLVETFAVLTIVRLVASPASWMQTYNLLLWPVFLMLALLQNATGPMLRRRRIWLPLTGVLLTNLAMHTKTWRLLGLEELVQQSRPLHLIVGLYTLWGLMLYALFLGWRSLAKEASPLPDRGGS